VSRLQAVFALAGLVALASAPVAASAPAADTPPADTPPADTPPADTAPLAPETPAPEPSPDAGTPPHSDRAEASGPQVLDAVLPCGLRLVVARDATLPVAAVVLAVETGTEDDPSAQPGLVHALTYQLLQGNRELVPGGATAVVHDSGGLTTLAIGPAQVRFESLVPASRLRDAVFTEAQRLRAPSVSDVLWADSLRWARRDKARQWGLPKEAIAAAHGAPGLAHDGHTVSPEVTAMKARAVSTALAQRFQYSRATLSVVAPGDLQETWAMVADAFASLPEATRVLPPRLTQGPNAASGTEPRQLPVDGVKGTTMLWPVGPTAQAELEATVWCKAINRQRRGDDDGKRARVRCRLDRDPRRTIVILKASGSSDPQALIARRFARLTSGADDTLVDRQREVLLANDTVYLRTPLALARRLSQDAHADAAPPGSPATEATRPLSDAVGHTDLVTGRSTPMRFGPHLELAAGIVLVPNAVLRPVDEGSGP